ncbi:MAG: antibiotic biosynthesis monooxygenase [Gammaproteobacteria bacterium]|jgi:uncharacterized protein|nr:antibiotic biosynthesis monooxygenase [Gammaproteobacteria bacterium]MBU0772997.1 antibiotic biosynthesis monooxygenase [Gammaproteobacteria bacterium]MBU0856495.1 antibiotic biosynthesis monooxygenase [Gammaproteobacteria bacterium]MBU1847725.1 antibiotic biosynthesis monooxygenase [Gammaproteobacteria bacterium]
MEQRPYVVGTPGSAHVTRIARRHARAGHEAAYEALIREMFAALRTMPGFLGAEMLPPEAPGGEYQIIVHFASEAELLAWDASPARDGLHQRLREVAENEPEYRCLSGLEAWFAPAVVPASTHPPRARMALVTWLGIFPTVSLFLWLVAPQLQSLPFLPRTALLTAMIVVTMTWVVMPRLTRWLRHWLTPPQRVDSGGR